MVALSSLLSFQCPMMMMMMMAQRRAMQAAQQRARTNVTLRNLQYEIPEDNFTDRTEFVEPVRPQ